jgi:uncharacterized SAM-binding protein YcdF (DUF218 family)
MVAFGFLAKKFISCFLYPLGFSILVCFLGALIWRRRPAGRLGPFLMVFGMLWLLVTSFPITGYLLVHPLEAEAGDYADPKDLAQRGVRHIVVLANATVTADSTPADRWDQGLFRLMEGVRLWKGMPNAVLVLSGGSYPGRQSSAEAMAVLPEQMGVPRKALVLETRAWDTMDEARLFAVIVGNKPFALVTSAAHMSRSLDLFKSLGVSPIPCPCDFRTRLSPAWYRWFMPTVEGLENSHVALHEYVGRLWLRARKVGVNLM